MTSRNSTPTGRAAAEKTTANTISPEGSDSGYGSTGNTTDGFNADHSQDLADGIALRPRRLFERKVTKLRLFDREIPQLTQHRFHDLHELFERPLCDYLIKSKVNVNPISVKLKVLGECEATAKPWIVVLCNETASKRIRQFFNQQQIKAEYQPSNPDPSLPSFEVFVWPRPPRPMAGTEIYGNDDNRSTMCGRIIKVGEAHQSRFATLGGVIKVVKPPRILTLYGMTAGHILLQKPLEQDSFDIFNVPDEENEEDEGFYSGEEEYELDDTSQGDEESPNLPTTGMKTQTISQSTPLGGWWPKIGSVSVVSIEGTSTGQDLDWALIDFERITDYRPNLLVLDSDEGAARNRPLKENGKTTEDGSSRAVFLLSGTGGVKSGTLSTSLSFLMMGPGKAFTKTYTLVLPHGSLLHAGDCGSWVVDPSTCEVYGHVVASDAMGDTYVVPLNATLQDMEEKLRAEVSLPTEADINTWLAQQAKAATKQITAPMKSERKKVAFKDSKMEKAEPQRDHRKPDGHPSPQASKSLAASAVETSTPIVDYCSSCNEELKGTSQDARSNSRRHMHTCSKNNKHTAPRVANPTSQDPGTSLDKRSKSTSVKDSIDVRQKATDKQSAHQSPLPWSIRSMYSNLKKNPVSESQQKDGDKGKDIGDSKSNKSAGSASSTKPAATISTAQSLKTNTKRSNSKKDSASPPFSRESPIPSLALIGGISREIPPAPILGPRPSLPATTPLPRLQQSGGLPASPPSRLAPPRSHDHESFHEGSLDSHHQSHKNNSGQVSYEGYTFIKCNSRETGQQETWAVARMVPMPVSQSDLKDQIKRDKKKHVSALDKYNGENMRGFKRMQVDNLIRERKKIDGDYGYEYVLASIKLDSRKITSQSFETVSMQVILERQLIAGIPHETPEEPSIDFHTKLPSQIMDLTTRDEFRKFGNSGGGRQNVGHEGTVVPFTGYPGYGAFPMSPAQGQLLGHGMQPVDNSIPFITATPYTFPSLHSPAQGMWLPPHPQRIPLGQQTSQNAQGQLVKVQKSNQNKKSPRIVDIRHESRKKLDYPSGSSSTSGLSSELDSDNSWTKTDATPDTVPSEVSRESRKEKKYRIESKDSSYSKDRIEEPPSAHRKEGPTYREHRRKEHRRSSLSPARRSRDVSPNRFDMDLEHPGRRATYLRHSRGTRYRDDEHYEVEPAISFPTNRASRHRRSSVSPGRPPHRRALSYDLDRPPMYNSRALIPRRPPPAVYREPTRDFAAEWAQGDWERERLQRTREEEEKCAMETERRARMEGDVRMPRRRSEREEGNVPTEGWRSHEMERREREETEAVMEMRRDMDERRRWREAGYDSGYMSGPRRDAGRYY